MGHASELSYPKNEEIQVFIYSFPALLVGCSRGVNFALSPYAEHILVAREKLRQNKNYLGRKFWKHRCTEWKVCQGALSVFYSSFINSFLKEKLTFWPLMYILQTKFLVNM